MIKKNIKHIVAIGILFFVCMVYCRSIADSASSRQEDLKQWKGMSAQSFDYKERTGHFPLWINNAFGGMPAYTIAMDTDTWVSYSLLDKILTLGLPEPFSFFFISCLCFYFLAMVFKVNSFVAILAAVGYTYCSSNIILLLSGHITQMLAIAYAPAVVASFILILKKRYLLGISLLSFFIASQFGTQHLQIIYYTLISLFILGVFYVIKMVKEDKLKEAMISLSFALLSISIGYGACAVLNIPLQDYSKETIRTGRTELRKKVSSNGLNKDYAFKWSYGIGETLTLAIPDMYGAGIGSTQINSKSKFVEKSTEYIGATQDQLVQIGNAYTYWGPQPFTNGAFYIGIIIIILCIVGFFIVTDWEKKWIITTAIIGLILAWGSNLSSINSLLFEYLPLYNKFRSPSMALFLVQLVLPLMAAITLNTILVDKNIIDKIKLNKKKLLYIIGGLVILFLGSYYFSTFKSKNDKQLRDNFYSSVINRIQPEQRKDPTVQSQVYGASREIINSLVEDRKDMAFSDIVRSIFFISLIVIALWLYKNGKISKHVLVGSIIILSCYDILNVTSRYIKTDDSGIVNEEQPTNLDKIIMSDTTKSFRVLDLSTNTFESAHGSNYYNSIGGYCPAKLGLYQDLIDSQLIKGNVKVFNMLNTKYFILPNKSTGMINLQSNPSAFGPCWFVKSIGYVGNGNEEMRALDSNSTKDIAIVQYKVAHNINIDYDSLDKINLVSNSNDTIVYRTSTKHPEFATFSEIYYDRGWNVYIDNKKSKYIRVDYLLRGMQVPVGNHTIKFVFEPKSYKIGFYISIIFNIIIYLLLVLTILVETKIINKFYKKNLVI